MDKIKIGVISGSLRKESFCKKTARAVSALMPDNFEMVTLEIGGLPLYNQDLDAANPPSEWTDFRRQLETIDGFLFVTPEYNRGLPAALKNALDAASRPRGENKWDGKPAAVIGVTIGRLGAFGAYHALRQTLGFLNVLVMNQPEAYISGAEALFNEKGALVNEETRQFFVKFAAAFSGWAEKTLRAFPRN